MTLSRPEALVSADSGFGVVHGLAWLTPAAMVERLDSASSADVGDRP